MLVDTNWPVTVGAKYQEKAERCWEIEQLVDRLIAGREYSKQKQAAQAVEIPFFRFSAWKKDGKIDLVFIPVAAQHDPSVAEEYKKTI